MKLLLDEYKETFEKTKALAEDLESRAAIAKKGTRGMERLSIDLSIAKEMLSDLRFNINWIRGNVQPENARGIERRAYYEREVPFENQWLERRSDDGQVLITERGFAEDTEGRFDEEIRRELVNEMKKCLTERQIEALDLVGGGFGPTEIGEMLGVSRRAINHRVRSAKKKIKSEGWMMM